MRSILHSLSRQSFGLLLIVSFTIFLGVSYAGKDDKNATGDKPATDDKPKDDKPKDGDKPKEGDKPKDGDKPKEEIVSSPKEVKPWGFRIDVFTHIGLPETPPQVQAGGSADDGLTDKERPTLPYLALLKNENPLVRRRAILKLTSLEDQAARLFVFPALLVRMDEEDDIDLKLLINENLNGDKRTGKKPVYSSPDKIESLLKVLTNPIPSPYRPAACEGLSVLYASEYADAAKRQEIRKAFETNLLDSTPEVQVAAAEALEFCDAVDRSNLDPQKAGIKQTVRLHLDVLWLRSQDQRPEDVVRLMQAGYSFFNLSPKLSGEAVIECQATDLQRVILLNRLRVPKKTGKKLREIARVEVVPEEKR